MAVAERLAGVDRRRTARKPLATRAAPAAAGWGALLVLLLAWELLARAGLIDAFTAPPPSAIAAELPTLFDEENLLGALLQTFAETLGATALAAMLGVPLGWLLHHQRRIGLAFEGWIAATAAAPLVLLYPLFLVVLGRNAATIVAMGVVAALPPIVLKTKEGFDAIRPALINVGRSLRLSPGRQLFKVLLPAATPTIGSGLRLALIFALINVVGIEFLINFGGMGAVIAGLADRFQLAEMFAAILFVVLTSVLFYVLTGGIERWLRRS